MTTGEIQESLTKNLLTDFARIKMSELLYDKFDDEIKLYKFLNRISNDKIVKVVAINRLSGYEEGSFELFYKFLED